MQDMASLLAEESMKEFNPHEVIEGTVVLVNRDEAYVDIGYKTEIPIAKKELAYPEPEAATDVVKVGDKINVYVVALGGENGLILSKTRADRLVAWEKVEKVKEEKQIIEVEILQVVKGGLLTTAFGLRGFIPASQIALHFVKDLNEFVGAYELGSVIADKAIICGDVKISLDEIETAYTQPLEQIFPTHVRKSTGETKQSELYTATSIAKAPTSFAKPRIFIPVFPGTNCEYDTAKAFNRAGGQAETLVIKNLTPSMVEESVEAIVKGIEKSQIIMLPGGFSGGDEPDGSGKFIAAMFRNPRITEAVRDLLKNRDGLMLGICNGFQALIKLGLVPFGDIQELTPENPTLTYNEIGRHVSCMVETKVVSNLSPWFNNVKVGDIHTIAVSHGEGRFCASPEVLAQLKANGQIATQYVNANGDTSMDIEVNPNGSVWAIEGITSPDGRILGKMGHSERIGKYVAKNVPGAKDQKLFEAGVAYFK